MILWRKKVGLEVPEKIDLDWIGRSAARWYYEIFSKMNVPRSVATNFPLIIPISQDILPSVRRKGSIYYDIIPAIWISEEGDIYIIDFVNNKTSERYREDLRKNKGLSTIVAIRLWAINRYLGNRQLDNIRHLIFFDNVSKIRSVVFNPQEDYSLQMEDAEFLIIGYSNGVMYPVPMSILCQKNCDYKDSCSW